MPGSKALRRIHLAATVWFMLCVGYLIVVKLRHDGFSWLAILSLSGPSALMLVIVALYPFAFVRGMSSTQRIQLEHPLTTAAYYMGFYISAPLLGGLVGMMKATANVGEIMDFLTVWALWTFYTTIIVWVGVDPLAGLIEMFLPASRRHRAQRLANAHVESQIRQEKREQLLTQALAREDQERLQWQENLRPHAEHLAALSAGRVPPGEQAEQEALRIGALAWKLGGLTCMRQLRNMTLHIAEQQYGRADAIDYVSHWWDGIGSWRGPQPL